jgi:hypothetical protein
MQGDHKVIGYFAISAQQDILCDGDACIIAGTQSALNSYIRSLAEPGVEFDNRKTRFSEILEGMERGGAYAFDERAYKLFYPLANQHGLKLKPQRFPQTESGMHFVVVRHEFT